MNSYDCLWNSPTIALAPDTISLAKDCLKILKRRRLPPTRMFIRDNTICMYFWDHNNYVDLEFRKDYVTLARNLQGTSEKGESMRIVQQWKVECSKEGILQAVKTIQKSVDRSEIAIDKRNAIE